MKLKGQVSTWGKLGDNVSWKVKGKYLDNSLKIFMKGSREMEQQFKGHADLRKKG